MKIEETGASLPEAQRVPATGSCHRRRSRRSSSTRSSRTHFEGDVAKRAGMGGLAAVDEVTMAVTPDIMSLGDDTQVRDLQGKMIAYREAPATAWRSSTPAGHAPAGHPRVAHEHCGATTRSSRRSTTLIEVSEPAGRTS